ncbi:class I SAM-dependent methyltransferase [Thermodesulfobacteriota bacterium]
MTARESIVKTAQDTSHLKGRIDANRGQQTDLNQWVFEKLRLQKGWRVLELCCGTGAQTNYLVKGVGIQGHVHALDISADAIENVNKTLGEQYDDRMTILEADIDDFTGRLAEQGLVESYFDLIFCSYGLYYCSNIQKTLGDMERWLKPTGKMAIVGPFGPNNKPLYDLLRENGVTPSDYVLHTSSTFMTEDVISWAVEKFEQVSIHSLVNPVVWESPQILMTYWKSSTFFDDTKRHAVQDHVEKHFQQRDTFINEKWVMLLIAENKRYQK